MNEKEKSVIRATLWNRTHPDRRKEIAKKYSDNNKEKKRIYYLLTKKHRYEYNRKYEALNKGRVLLWKKKYYYKNRDKILLKQKMFKKAHPDIMRERWKRHAEKSMNYKLRHSCRLRIKNALGDIRANEKTIILLGCSVNELKVYLENKFKPGMTWKNYGYRGWHIDHIRPIASFDLNDPEQRKQCFNFNNLQPLWARENMLKRDKYEKNNIDNIINFNIA